MIDGYEGQNKTAPNFTKRDWRKLMEEIGCKGMVPYSYRHTFSSPEPSALEAIVGHVDRETTIIYTHLHNENLIDVVQVIKEKHLAVCNKSATQSEPAKSSIQKVRKTKKSTQNLTILGT